MSRAKIRELTEQLAEELAEDDELDPAERAALRALTTEVTMALAGEPVPEPPSDRALGLVERLEQEHPELTALVQRLADALMAAGL